MIIIRKLKRGQNNRYDVYDGLLKVKESVIIIIF